MTGKAVLFALSLVLTSSVSLANPNFPIPSMCNGNDVTGSGTGNPSDAAPPIVEILASATEDGEVSVVGIEPQDVYQLRGSNFWTANIVGVVGHPYYIVTTSYTPFLETIHLFVNHESHFVLPLQAHAQRDGQTDLESLEDRPYSNIEVRVYDEDEQAIPNGIVEFEPQFEGSSPYTIEADKNGVIHLSCVYYSNPNNHRITVLSADSEFLYDGAIVVEYVSGTQGLAFTYKEDTQ